MTFSFISDVNSCLIVVMKTRQERLTILQNCRLYGIIDLGYVSQSDALSVAEELLNAGMSVLQLRAKNIALDIVEDLAIQLVELVASYSAIFILNDYPELAVKVGADGVHVGQELQDASATNLDVVRANIGKDLIIGHSTHSYQQAIKAKQDRADYIGFGPLFATQTKPGRAAIGLNEIEQVRAELGLEYPVFCIGGVNGKTLSSVLDSGANRVVIVSDLLLSKDIASKAKSLLEKLS